MNSTDGRQLFNDLPPVSQRFLAIRSADWKSARELRGIVIKVRALLCALALSLSAAHFGCSD